MANNWFQCKLRYEKVTENGIVKKVTEPYLMNALSFTEAEARIVEELTPFMSGEFTVSDIKRANYSELFDQFGGDRYYKCKLQFVTIDQKSAKEKKTSSYILVLADNFREAVKNLDEGMKGTLADYTIISVNETAIMDAYEFDATKVEYKESEDGFVLKIDVTKQLKEAIAERRNKK